MNEPNIPGGLPRWAEKVALGAIIISVLAIIFESVQSLARAYEQVFAALDVILGIAFISEYVWRSIRTQSVAWSMRSWAKYGLGFYGLVDAICIIPIVISASPEGLMAIKTLRLLRIFRVLKIARYSKSLQLLGKVVNTVRLELLTTFFLACFTILLSSIAMYFLEHEVQPDAFPDIPTTFWWGVTTLTTVGYGDIYPISVSGRLLAAVIAMTGIGVVAIPTGLISAAFVSEIGPKED
jgi:voltage-gated potassium channel